MAKYLCQIKTKQMQPELNPCGSYVCTRCNLSCANKKSLCRPSKLKAKSTQSFMKLAKKQKLKSPPNKAPQKQSGQKQPAQIQLNNQQDKNEKIQAIILRVKQEKEQAALALTPSNRPAKSFDKQESKTALSIESQVITQDSLKQSLSALKQIKKQAKKEKKQIKQQTKLIKKELKLNKKYQKLLKKQPSACKNTSMAKVDNINQAEKSLTLNSKQMNLKQTIHSHILKTQDLLNTQRIGRAKLH